MPPSATSTATMVTDSSDVEQGGGDVELTMLMPPEGEGEEEPRGAMGFTGTNGADARHSKKQGSSARSTPPLTPPSASKGNRNSRRSRKSLSLDSLSTGGRNGRAGDADDSCKSSKRTASSLRRRKRGSTCRNRLVGLVMCAGTGWGAIHVGWWMYWAARCHEGCYEKATATGAEGPEQIHLAYAGVDKDGNPSGMTVMWTTAAGETPPTVEYGLSPDKLNLSATGTSVQYLDTVHHRATIEELTLGTRIYYRVGHPSEEEQKMGAGEKEGAPDNKRTRDQHDPPAFEVTAAGRADGTDYPETRREESYGRWSSVSSFVTAPDRQRWAGDGPWDRPVSVAVVGDWGLVNAGSTFDRLHQVAEDGEIDFVLHLGDIAYADDAFLERPWAFGYEAKWDAFMRRASHDFASKVPYMVVPGNHEAECHSPACLFSARRVKALRHFNAYNARFRMPSIESGAEHGTAMWYSFNLGPVHWIVIDTETDFPHAPGDKYTRMGSGDGVGNGGFGDQMAWLEEDLAKADQERDLRPWIIVSGHRPMYSKEGLSASGLPNGNDEHVRRAFEPLLMRYKADVYLSGHVHTYERSYPVFDGDVHFDTENAEIPALVYDDPTAPVHVVNGAGGNIEGMTLPRPISHRGFPEWHARSMRLDQGVGILTFDSMNEMRASFVTSASPAEVEDELTLRHHRLSTIAESEQDKKTP